MLLGTKLAFWIIIWDKQLKSKNKDMEITDKKLRNITKKYNLDKPKQTNSSRRVDGEIIIKEITEETFPD